MKKRNTIVEKEDTQSKYEYDYKMRSGNEYDVPSMKTFDGRKGGGASPIRRLRSTWTINIHGMPTILPPEKS